MTAFPSLTIRADGLEPQGTYAEAQAEFLEPDTVAVAALDELLEAGRVGVVAHFYMDAELQGTLSALSWPHVHISDSLAMADAAVAQAEAGCEAICVLGVDFMSENVRAVLDAAGHKGVRVYRAAEAAIGCSLAESAERDAYGAWLTRAADQPRALHVIYINTSLGVKARAHALLPTITCTSSNVVATVLAAAEQIEDVRIFYGPDTYMGANLEQLLGGLAEAGDHRAAVARGRFDYFRQGTCIVHHLFGAEVSRRIASEHADAAICAHLEVPGEMFALGMAAERKGRGVVGSTSDILSFIRGQVGQAAKGAGSARIPVVLGTEAGMVTSIVSGVRDALAGRDDIEVEIIFPVAAEAVMQVNDDATGLGVVPGAAAGEGCSVEGGCATCPYMKMNSLDALTDLLGARARGADLSAYEPERLHDNIDGIPTTELGAEPILAMRRFQQDGRLPPDLVRRLKSDRL